MTDLNDAVARAMGWTPERSITVGMSKHIIGWFDRGYWHSAKDWAPDTNPRDAWEVLRWLWSLIDPLGAPRFIVELSHGIHYFVVLYPFDNTRPPIEVWGETEQEAICLAAIEVGRDG